MLAILLVLAVTCSSVLGARNLQATAAAPAPAASTKLTNLPCPIANGTIRVGLWSASDLPILAVTATKPFTLSENAGASGFEFNIIKAISLLVNCKSLTLVPLPDLPSRITALQTGLVDVVISSFSVTPAREKLIDFIRPFYYGAGAALFTTPANAATLTSWSSIKGLTICAPDGNYAIPSLTGTYGAKILVVADTAAAKASITSGACTAYLQDSTVVIAGLPQVSALAPLLVSPYGIAVAQGQDVLFATLTAISTVMESNGPDSLILVLEAQDLVPSGVGPLKTLNTTVNAITNFA